MIPIRAHTYAPKPSLHPCNLRIRRCGWAENFQVVVWINVGSELGLVKAPRCLAASCCEMFQNRDSNPGVLPPVSPDRKGVLDNSASMPLLTGFWVSRGHEQITWPREAWERQCRGRCSASGFPDPCYRFLLLPERTTATDQRYAPAKRCWWLRGLGQGELEFEASNLTPEVIGQNSWP